MLNTKFCKDCKHILVEDDRIGYAKCGASTKESPDYLVTGLAVYREHYYCSTARKDETMCGLNARWFEPKEPAP
jgi:hypothetical protein